MNPKKSTGKPIVLILVIAVIALIAYFMLRGGRKPEASKEEAKGAAAAPDATPIVELTDKQVEAIKIEPVGSYSFPLEKTAVGSIDFDEDLAVPVFAPYQGKIISAFSGLGDEVQKGQALYTIDSPDLVQAESTLIAAAAALELTTSELNRAKALHGVAQGVSQRELEQAVSDQQTAEGNLRAARSAVLVFGKTPAEIDQIVASRTIDPALVVKSPITGQITARNAQPGLLVQPGVTPAPYSVADGSTKWMLANVTEGESPLIRTGMPVRVKVMALPDEQFEGKISAMAALVDPNTHRVMVRSDVLDPKHELRPGMLATFVIEVKPAVSATAIPANGVVREGDGTMTAWVTNDRRKFFQRKVKLGLQKDGNYEALDGLKKGELAVTDGAVFLSNILEAGPSD
jgi:cobalt-zinc-cadmium efflux system membrane fusion protein